MVVDTDITGVIGWKSGAADGKGSGVKQLRFLFAAQPKDWYLDFEGCGTGVQP